MCVQNIREQCSALGRIVILQDIAALAKITNTTKLNIFAQHLQLLRLQMTRSSLCLRTVCSKWNWNSLDAAHVVIKENLSLKMMHKMFEQCILNSLSIIEM